MTMRKPLKNFHFLCKTFLLLGHTASCQGLMMLEKWRTLTLQDASFPFLSDHWLYPKIPNSPPRNLCFFFATLQRVVLLVENHISILREANRECPVHPTRVEPRELQNAHRCHLTYTLSLWDRLCSSNYKNKENGIFLRGVKAIHPAW